MGVGASAGGLEAFRQLLAHVPGDSGAAFVLVQHLEATRASLLCDALAQSTPMTVAQASDGARVEPNCVYVIPPGARMAIDRGALRLSPLEAGERRPHLPIDFFLRSLAADRGRQAVGVILSGTASDGTAGLTAIREHGGITFAQDPRTAGSGQMPRSAIDAGVVDFTLPLPALGAELARIARHAWVARSEPSSPAGSGGLSLARIVALLRASTGVDFGEHRTAPLLRRLGRRMALRERKDLASYAELLRKDPAEVRALHDDLLAGVTAFFRDEREFEELKATAFPAILKHKAPGAPIRAWVVGCATGEEVYSLAISLLEHLDLARAEHPVLIFGSDVDEKSIERARTGVFPEAAVQDLGEERLQRFFVRTEGGWRVGRAVRDLCVFVRHDVGSDPPFSRLDLVTCRNVLVSFGHALQRRVLAALHYSLNQPGFLLLDRSENATGVSKWFLPSRKGSGLVRRRPGSSKFRLPPKGRSPSLRALPGVAAPFALSSEERAAANEDLQSLIEELETAREELQATNEELTTVNDELHGRNKDLQVANADLGSLLDAIEIPIVILDEGRRIRRFTSRASTSLGLLPAHLGRRIGEIDLPIHAPDLECWIVRATREAILVEAEVQDRAGRWHRLQVRPHGASGAGTGGVILSLVDIDDLRHEVVNATWARDYARGIVEAVQVPLVVLDSGLCVLSANAAYYRIFQEEPSRTEGQGFFELGAGEWNATALHDAVVAIRGAEGRFEGLAVERGVQGDGFRSTVVSGCAVPSPAGANLILLAIEDVTARPRSEEVSS